MRNSKRLSTDFNRLTTISVKPNARSNRGKLLLLSNGYSLMYADVLAIFANQRRNATRWLLKQFSADISTLLLSKLKSVPLNALTIFLLLAFLFEHSYLSTPL